MRKLTLILIVLLAACGLAFGVSAEPVEETATAAEVLSIFAADEAELDVMLVLSGEAPTFDPTVGAGSCVEDCAREELRCLVGCGFTPLCQLFCSEEFEICASGC